MPEIGGMAVETESAVYVRRPDIGSVTRTHIGVAAIDGHIPTVIDIDIPVTPINVAVVCPVAAVSVYVPVAIAAFYIGSPNTITPVCAAVICPVRSVFCLVVVLVSRSVGRTIIIPVGCFRFGITPVGGTLMTTVYGRTPVRGRRPGLAVHG
jgi:hypothetical protein